MAKMTPQFDITPEDEAKMSRYFYRQFFVKTPALTRRDADLSGKTAIVTGSNTGLGLETSRQLFELGLSKLIMGVRSIPKAELAREKLLADYNSRSRKEGGAAGKNNNSKIEIEIWKLDMSSYESVTAFAERAKGLESLDLVVLNAGVYKITEEFNPSTGYDEDVQVNYLSTALLTLTLLPVLKSKSKSTSSNSRLTIVSSDAAAWVKFAEKQHKPLLQAFKRKTEGWAMQERYGTSKLLGQLFFAELVRRVPRKNLLGSGSGVVLDTVNPGFCYGSELSREGKGKLAGYAVRVVTRVIGKPLYMGARSIVHAAAGWGSGEEIHGQYIEDGLIRPMAPIIYTSEGEEIARRIWDETMDELSFAGVKEIVAELEK